MAKPLSRSRSVLTVLALGAVLDKEHWRPRSAFSTLVLDKWARPRGGSWAPRDPASGHLHGRPGKQYLKALSGAVLEREVRQFSGLEGRPLQPGRRFPTMSEVKRVIPKHCYKRSSLRSLSHVVRDVSMVLACGAAAGTFLPFTAAAAPLWAVYALVTGTIATGAWVLAHECGHGAFSNRKWLQTAVGYTLHSAMLVPYFAWQRSHAVHHRYTNHMTLGESHVPETRDTVLGKVSRSVEGALCRVLGRRLGSRAWGAIQLFLHLVVGWPSYLLFGATGGPDHGVTNHFVPFTLDGQKPKEPLFPRGWAKKVYQSDVGIAAMLCVLGLATWQWGFGRVFALYIGPLLVTNAWLVAYTWLQHTDVDMPHFSDDHHTFVKGAFHTVDRPYDKLLGGVIDSLHHKIGTTHVLHHIDCKIPFYHAAEATRAVSKAFPDLYLRDDTPVPRALWRVAKFCTVVEQRGDMWVWA